MYRSGADGAAGGSAALSLQGSHRKGDGMNLIGNSSCIGEIQTKKIRVYGIVQGVGFRPTVSRHAAAAGIRGTVCNCGPYVEILAQGTEAQIGSFLSLLEEQIGRASCRERV